MLRADWLYAATGSVALPIASDSWVALVRVSIATQLNSTWRRVELSCVAINGPLAFTSTSLHMVHQRQLLSFTTRLNDEMSQEQRSYNDHSATSTLSPWNNNNNIYNSLYWNQVDKRNSLQWHTHTPNKLPRRTALYRTQSFGTQAFNTTKRSMQCLARIERHAAISQAAQ